MSLDQVALLPAYCAAGTAVLVFLVDLLVEHVVRQGDVERAGYMIFIVKK